MGYLKKKLARLTQYYNVLAIICFNSLLLFAVINVIAAVGLYLKGYFEDRAAVKGIPWVYREFHESLTKVHPGMTKEQIGKLIAETKDITREYDVYTQFKEIPCAGEYVKVHSRGFRPIRDQKPWPPRKGDYVVFVFGGSTTFGYGVPNDLTFASHLQMLLGSDYGVSASVYNFGRGSYFSVQERLFFEKLLLRGYIPQMVVFIDGLNDLTLFDGIPDHTEDLKRFMKDGEIPPTRQVIRELPVVKALTSLTSSGQGNKFARREFFSKAPPDEQSKLLQRVVERYKANKRMIEAICREFNVIPVFVWQPVPVYKYNPRYNIFGGFDYATGFPTLEPGYNLMARAVESGTFNRNFIWAADVQENLQKPLYVDAVHYSGEMSKILAKYVLEKITERGLDARLSPLTPLQGKHLISKDRN